MQTKIGFLSAAVVLILSILFWPIYFFGLSGLEIIGTGIADLGLFVVVELVLIIILVISWKIYEKLH
ncbi:MAG: hypothetical protein HOE11_03665 [Candidatus Diapherotrites archaeon]|jgi:hypothetical protein|nr:hypothetical protein [Candidatus Diapherotrites archaeon]MBT4597254.1 hypothetical protein [Candidatus Diapherotrites archaeon]